MDRELLEQLPRFRWEDIQRHLTEKKPFETLSPMGTALIRVREYTPLFGLAIHAGHQVRDEMISKMAIEEDERRYEEDEAAEAFVTNFPVQMIALDSRYEYDLNRSRESSVYLKPFQSWGRKVWNNPPSKDELEISYQKYDEFHELLDFLVEQFVEQHGGALVFDVHSYNHKRQSYLGRAKPLPEFNLATSEKDRKEFGPLIQAVSDQLKNSNILTDPIAVAENDVFIKDGAVALALAEKHPNVLTLPIEVKKIYMDEDTGDIDKVMVEKLAELFGKVGRLTLEHYQKSKPK